jgi:hypothetical protein
VTATATERRGDTTMASIHRLLIAIALISLASIPATAEVVIDGTTVTETPALYQQYIKFLTVPPDKQTDPAFTGADIAKIKALEDATRREIWDRMILANPERFAFANLAEAQQIWTMRLTIIADMDKMNQGVIKWRYFSYSDATKAVKAGSAKWQNGDFTDFYFKVKAGQTAHAAIKDILAGTTYGECAGAITACYFDGAATALGQPGFDAIHAAGTLEVGWDGPIDDHMYAPTNAAVLIPGDKIYFKNKSDYVQRCRDRGVSGFWQGENCVYMGADKYAGLGARGPGGAIRLSSAQMRAELKDAYEKDTQKAFVGSVDTEITTIRLKRPRLKP